MVDITNDIHVFRESARHIWNAYLVERAENSGGVVLEAFGRVCEELFEVLVLDTNSIDEPAEKLNVEEFAAIRVVPALENGTPILVNRTSPAGTYWDDPLTSVMPMDVELALIGFFDWNSIGQIDLRYLRVCVLASSTHPLIVGRHALIEVAHVRVMA